MNVKRYVNMAFVLCALLAWVCFSPFYAWVIELVAPAWDKPLIGVDFRVSNILGFVSACVLSIWAWTNERVYGQALEIGNELTKVTWPKWDETRISTIVVIVTTLIVASILGLFDFVWAKVTSLI